MKHNKLFSSIAILLLFCTNLLAQSRVTTNTSYKYDNMNRLIETSDKLSRKIFTYDELGNRLSHRLEYIIPPTSFDTIQGLVSCIYNDSGFLYVTALNTNYDYLISVDKFALGMIGSKKLLNSSNSWKDSLAVPDASGYDLVIEIVGIDSAVYTKRIRFQLRNEHYFTLYYQYKDDYTVTINPVGGGKPFSVFVNNILRYVTNDDFIDVPIVSDSWIRVESARDCDPILQRKFTVPNPPTPPLPNDTTYTSKVYVYPNPTSDDVTLHTLQFIDAEPIGLSIYDANGKLVDKFSRYPVQQKITFSISDLASGIYIIQIQRTVPLDNGYVDHTNIIDIVKVLKQ